jgi:hypothetical protein
MEKTEKMEKMEKTKKLIKNVNIYKYYISYYIDVVFIHPMKRIQTNEYSNPSKIIGIQFSMLSPEEIRKKSKRI